jgi:hypothetical protein
MGTCMQTARITSVGRIAAAHEGIALGCVRFGALPAVVLPYACVAGDGISIFCANRRQEIPNPTAYKNMCDMRSTIKHGFFLERLAKSAYGTWCAPSAESVTKRRLTARLYRASGAMLDDEEIPVLIKCTASWKCTAIASQTEHGSLCRSKRSPALRVDCRA